jgi:diadenosine tetraphosphatase ApaH/serine/threonine PP2A family protein phosphatase
VTELSRRYAIISDLHSNIEALSAVLEDIRAREIEDIICLGDVVGYGPNPRECLDLVMASCRVCLLGNHDEAVLKGAHNFNAWAREAIDWTREVLSENGAAAADNRRRWAYIEAMPLKFQTNGLYFVHGSPRQPTIEYILREDIYNGAYDKFNQIFESFGKCLFVGHSHTPCVINEDLDYLTPKDCDEHFVYTRDRKKIIVNVGSVGQPRDNDTRSCYVEIAMNEIIFHRVPYDVKAVVQKIKDNKRLSDNLGMRLQKGV